MWRSVGRCRRHLPLTPHLLLLELGDDGIGFGMRQCQHQVMRLLEPDGLLVNVRLRAGCCAGGSGRMAPHAGSPTVQRSKHLAHLAHFILEPVLLCQLVHDSAPALGGRAEDDLEGGLHAQQALHACLHGAGSLLNLLVLDGGWMEAVKGSDCTGPPAYSSCRAPGPIPACPPLPPPRPRHRRHPPPHPPPGQTRKRAACQTPRTPGPSTC